MRVEGKKVNFLGDSITEGAGASCPENKYVEVFARKFSPAAARNYGIGGTRIAKQTKPSECERYDRDFCTRLYEMDEDADIVVIFGGTNDYGHGDAPFGDFSDRTPDTFLGACHYLMRGAIERYPDATIVIMTPMHRAIEEQENRHSLYEYVEGIRACAEFYSIPVLDLYKNLGIQPQIEAHRVRFAPDGLHPNDRGAEKIADMLGKFIEAL